jgi:hypothetical protein
VALPHAYKPEHLVDDAPESVGGLASFLTERRVAEIGAALKALVTGQDLPDDHGLGTDDEDAVAVVIHNEMSDDVAIVHHTFHDSSSHDEKETIEEGNSFVFTAKTGDRFEAFVGNQKLDDYQVRAEKGGADDFIISSPTNE